LIKYIEDWGKFIKWMISNKIKTKGKIWGKMFKVQFMLAFFIGRILEFFFFDEWFFFLIEAFKALKALDSLKIFIRILQMFPSATERCKKEFFLLIEIKKNLSSLFFFLLKHKSLLYKKERIYLIYYSKIIFFFLLWIGKRLH
jgi:hypothetical protein